MPGWDPHSPAHLDLFISFDASICSVMIFPPLKNFDHVVVSVFIDFPSNFSSQNLTILVLIGIVFMIIWEMFHGKIYLNLMLLLLVLNFLR